MPQSKIVTILLEAIFDENPRLNRQKNMPVCCAKHLNELREVILTEHMDNIKVVGTSYLWMKDNRVIVFNGANSSEYSLKALDYEILAMPPAQRPAVYNISPVEQALSEHIKTAMKDMPPEVAAGLVRAMKDGRVRFINEDQLDDVMSTDQSDTAVLFDNDTTTIIGQKPEGGPSLDEIFAQKSGSQPSLSEMFNSIFGNGTKY